MALMPQARFRRVCVYVQAWHSVHTGASFIVLFLFEEAHVSVCQRVCGQPVTCWRGLWEARPPPLLWNCQLVGHISDWSVTHTLVSSPEDDRKDKLISQSKLLISTSLGFPYLPLFLFLSLASIYHHHYHHPLYFCRLLSLFPLSLPPYLSISIILLPVITPPPPTYQLSRLSLSLRLSPFCPSLHLYSNLLKGIELLFPSEAIQLVLSALWEFFFLLPKWALAAAATATAPNSFKGKQARGERLDVSIHSSSLSRSPPLKGNLFTLMDKFVWMYERWTDEGVCK